MSAGQAFSKIPTFFALPEVAARLGKSKRWLREFLLENPTGIRIGNTILLTEPDVEAILIRAGAYVKIGTAADVARRFAVLQIANAEELELVLHIAGDARVEADLHQLFHGDRIRGEWFRYSDAIRTWIAEQGSAQE